MVIPVAAINIPTNTKIATLTQVPWYRAMAAPHATQNHPRMLKESDIREEMRLRHSCKLQMAWKCPLEYSETCQKLNVTNRTFVYNTESFYCSYKYNVT